MVEESKESFETCSQCESKGKQNCSIHSSIVTPKDCVNFLLSQHEVEYHGHFRKKYYYDKSKFSSAEEVFTDTSEEKLYPPFDKMTKTERKCSEKQRSRYYGNTGNAMQGNLIDYLNDIEKGQYCPLKEFLQDAIRLQNTTVVTESDMIWRVMKILCEWKIPPTQVIAKSETNISYLVVPYSSLSFISIDSFMKKQLCTKEHIFPFHCNNQAYFGYSGPIPAKELFVSTLDTEEIIKKKINYIQENGKQSWNFFYEMKKQLEWQSNELSEKGCVLNSLADDIQNLIRETCDPSWKNVSVFSYMTLSQFGKHLCSCLCLEKNDIRTCKQFHQNLYSANASEFEYMFTQFEASQRPNENLYGGFLTNSIYWMDKYPIDFYSETTKTIIELLECKSHLHYPCRVYKGLNKKTAFGRTYDEENQRRKLRKQYITSKYKDKVKAYEEKWECDWNFDMLKNSEFLQFKKDFVGLKLVKDKSGRLKKPLKRLKMADAIRGGKNDIFHMYFSKEKMPEYECVFLDYFSAYGSILMDKFPKGPYKRLCQDKLFNYVEFDEKNKVLINKITNEKAVGLIKCSLEVPKNEMDAFVPYVYEKVKSNDGGKDIAVGILCHECYESGDTECEHQNQVIEATMTISDFHQALSRNYTFKGGTFHIANKLTVEK